MTDVYHDPTRECGIPPMEIPPMEFFQWVIWVVWILDSPNRCIFLRDTSDHWSSSPNWIWLHSKTKWPSFAFFGHIKDGPALNMQHYISSIITIWGGCQWLHCLVKTHCRSVTKKIWGHGWSMTKPFVNDLLRNSAATCRLDWLGKCAFHVSSLSMCDDVRCIRKMSSRKISPTEYKRVRPRS